jgi:glutaredoxin
MMFYAYSYAVIFSLLLEILPVRPFKTTSRILGSSKFSLSSLSSNSQSQYSNDGNANAVSIFTTIGCKYCRIAKAKLSELGVLYSEYDIRDKYDLKPTDGVIVSNGEVLRRDVKSSDVLEFEMRLAHARGSTVPQIYVADEHVGGCDRLLEEVDVGTFQQRLKRHRITLTDASVVTETAPPRAKEQGKLAIKVGKPTVALNVLDTFSQQSEGL